MLMRIDAISHNLDRVGVGTGVYSLGAPGKSSSGCGLPSRLSRPAYYGLPNVPGTPQGGPTSQILEKKLFCQIPLTASGSNRPHRVHLQGRWFPAGMGFGCNGNLHVMAE